MDILKNKLPPGLSYALSPLKLEVAIAERGILLPVSLHQKHKIWAASFPAFSGTYYPHGSYKGNQTDKIVVRSCAISSRDRKALQRYAESVFLPALINWITSIEMQPHNSTLRREIQEFTCVDSPLAQTPPRLEMLTNAVKARIRHD